MKQHTDSDIAIVVDGAADDLASATSIVASVRGSKGIVRKQVEVDGDTVRFHITPDDTAAIGVGIAAAEVTISMADGNVAKTDTVYISISQAVDAEVG